MSIKQRSWQSRLISKLNTISQKLVDNAIENSGLLTDLIRIKATVSKQGDIQTRTIEGIDVISMIFPSITDLPFWRFINGGVPRPAEVTSESSTSGEKNELFECYVPLSISIDQHDLLLKYFDSGNQDVPWILILQVKDLLGTYGGRKLIWRKVHLTFYDEALPQPLLDFCTQMAQRRKILKW